MMAAPAPVNMDTGRWLFEDLTATSFAPTPEAESHRGRKRHRSLTRCGTTAVNGGGSGQSSTFRGRPRRRSTSPLGAASRHPSRGPVDASLSPARKRLLRIVVIDREQRRSQSPSRSRSPRCQQQKKQQQSRRRRRTRSRSRNHEEKAYLYEEPGTDLRHEVLLRRANRPVEDKE